jgi:mRNA interferase MazF
VKRGDFYRVYKPAGDAKLYRIFIVVSRQTLLNSKFSTVICAPVFTGGEGLSTQVPVGVSEGLKHSSWIMCDNLVSVPKGDLSQFLGALQRSRFNELDHALKMALELD